MAKYLLVKSIGLFVPKYGRPQEEIWSVLKRYIFERDRGQCHDCKAIVQLHTSNCHHVRPIAEGGTNHPANLKTLCLSCHKKCHPHMEK